ncbi:MAG: glycoside hydrolase family 2 [Ruminococcaceae bacterium]|nr:glycoside hydrolase family 2 [Oscillospiraceae bacterium]
MSSSEITNFVSLKTEFENGLSLSEIPFSVYPRPQLVRDNWMCLNGKWKFSLKSKEEKEYAGEIVVPFPPESRISGIEREIKDNEVMIYERSFVFDEKTDGKKIILHFGAVDQYTKVYLNGELVGENTGGYLPFSFDVTDKVLFGVNFLSVEVRDPLDIDLPYGKQRKDRGGMWYTKISGIWQTVWLETVPCEYIERIKIDTNLKGAVISVFGGVSEKMLLLKTEKGIKEFEFCGDKVEIKLDEPHLWTPEDPYLYEFDLICGEDKVSSYFGLRTISIKEVNGISYICLNDKPYFFHGLLDQGYFSDGIFTPAAAEGYKNDILKMKACGFNMLRKHIKLEPDIFYYYCDKYGMIVFQDMINNGKYSFILDTALPTVFLKKGVSHRASKKRREAFIETSKGIIENLYDHPSVVYYTIFNEGWGQFSSSECYKLFKSLDPSRIYDTASGWFKEKDSDVESEHVYFKPVKLEWNKKKPMVLSEFGGYSCKIEDHSFNRDKTYGYRFYEKVEDFRKALSSLYLDEVLPAIEQGLSGAVLTQVSDVEDETNGLMTYDRRVLKVDEGEMKKVSEKLIKKFYDNIR